MAKFRRIEDLDVAGRRVLVRVDLNVPMQDGRVTDATRIRRLAPTLNSLAERGAKVIVLSHFGRPKGRQPALSMAALAAPLGEALGGRKVAFAEDCVGPVAEAAVGRLKDGEVLLLENVRFHPEEEKNDPAFTARLAALGDLYVNDAFSAAHRAHASTCGLAAHLPAAAGKLMEAELDALGAALEHPERPVAAIVGGAKVSSKIDLLANLVGRVDALIIGGGMANTFLAAHGVAVGKSLCERDRLAVVETIEARARESGCVILLPVDAVVARKFEAGAPREVVPIGQVPDDAMILDVGPESVRRFAERLGASRTLVWNGPLGAFELDGFADGTMALARRAADLTAAGSLRSVAGGGDTVAALAQAGVVERFSYVSTAGGAFLEWLEGKELPGVRALLLPG